MTDHDFFAAMAVGIPPITPPVTPAPLPAESNSELGSSFCLAPLANSFECRVGFKPQAVRQFARGNNEPQTIRDGGSKVFLPFFLTIFPFMRTYLICVNSERRCQGFTCAQKPSESHPSGRRNCVETRKHLLQYLPRQLPGSVVDLPSEVTAPHKEVFDIVPSKHPGQPSQRGTHDFQLCAAIRKNNLPFAFTVIGCLFSAFADIALLRFLSSACQQVCLTSKPEDRSSRHSRNQYGQPRQDSGKYCNNNCPGIPVNYTCRPQRPALIEAKPPIHFLIPLWTRRHSAMPWRTESCHG